LSQIRAEDVGGWRAVESQLPRYVAEGAAGVQERVPRLEALDEGRVDGERGDVEV